MNIATSQWATLGGTLPHLPHLLTLAQRVRTQSFWSVLSALRPGPQDPWLWLWCVGCLPMPISVHIINQAFVCVLQIIWYDWLGWVISWYVQPWSEAFFKPSTLSRECRAGPVFWYLVNLLGHHAVNVILGRHFGCVMLGVHGWEWQCTLYQSQKWCT